MEEGPDDEVSKHRDRFLLVTTVIWVGWVSTMVTMMTMMFRKKETGCRLLPRGRVRVSSVCGIGAGGHNQGALRTGGGKGCLLLTR